MRTPLVLIIVVILALFFIYWPTGDPTPKAKYTPHPLKLLESLPTDTFSGEAHPVKLRKGEALVEGLPHQGRAFILLLYTKNSDTLISTKATI